MARIVVAEHEPHHRETLEWLLRKEGHVVLPTSSMMETLLAVQSARPELALIDVDIPGLGGWKLIEVMRDDPVARSVPVLGMSTAPIRGRTPHDVAVFTKPVCNTRLLRSVNAILGGGATGSWKTIPPDGRV
jgi:CheY-like chemotaxis protein